MVKPIKLRGGSKHYIHINGYVFKVYNFKEVRIPIKVTQSIPRVRLNNQNFNMIFLMVEYFGEKKYSINKF